MTVTEFKPVGQIIVESSRKREQYRDIDNTDCDYVANTQPPRCTPKCP
jgi:hypothetical protein